MVPTNAKAATGLMRIFPRTSRRQRGLSLVEVLVILVLLGLLSAVVVMAVPDDRDPAEAAAMSLAARIEAAQAEAIAKGQVYGIDLEPTELRLLARKDDGWAPFYSKALSNPDGAALQISYLVNGTPPPSEIGTIADRLTFDGPFGEEEEPAVTIDSLLMPTGEADPISLTVRSPTSQWEVRLSGNGTLAVFEADDG